MAVDKITVAGIIQSNGGNMTSAKLTETLMSDYHLDKTEAGNIVEDFKSCRLVKFENDVFSFV